MTEALQRLLALPVAIHDASPLLQLAHSMAGREDVAAIGERAQQVLLQQVREGVAATGRGRGCPLGSAPSRSCCSR